MKTTIYLVRHCEARGNIDRVFQGHYDADISENGRLQLERLAERFKDIPLDAVYSSPLKRARQTAEAVNRYHHLPIELDERLEEINGGHWEGVHWDELPVRFPEEYDDWLKRPWLFCPEEGEAMTAVYTRMKQALTEIAAANRGKTVAVASHGCAIRNALCWLKGYPPERINEVEWCDNTAVSLLEFDENLQPAILFENDNTHLGDELTTITKQAWWKELVGGPERQTD